MCNFGNFCADSADGSVRLAAKLARGLPPPKSPKVSSYKVNTAAAVRKMAAAMAAGNSELNRQVANNAKKNETRRNPNIRTNERNKSIRIWFEMDRKC